VSPELNYALSFAKEFNNRFTGFIENFGSSQKFEMNLYFDDGIV